MLQINAGDKSKIQNLKFQISTNNLKSKLNSSLTFMFGILNLFVIWCFGFDAYRITSAPIENEK